MKLFKYIFNIHNEKYMLFGIDGILTGSILFIILAFYSSREVECRVVTKEHNVLSLMFISVYVYILEGSVFLYCISIITWQAESNAKHIHLSTIS